jgi:hypothetical protein
MLGLELKDCTLSTLYFCDGFFQDRVSWTICPGWLRTVILLISVFWVAKITGMSLCHLAENYFLLSCYLKLPKLSFREKSAALGSVCLAAVAPAFGGDSGAKVHMRTVVCFAFWVTSSMSYLRSPPYLEFFFFLRGCEVETGSFCVAEAGLKSVIFLQSAGITGVHHLAWLRITLFNEANWC